MVRAMSRSQTPGGGPPTPYRRVRSRAEIPEALKDALPRRWELIGNVLRFRLPGVLRAHTDAVCRAYAEVLGAKAVLDASEGVSGIYRRPRSDLLWGGPTETTHQENGIRYRLDPSRIMWSSGNVGERIRMGRTARPGETVVDLFAGIGYFALPMALHGRAQRVVACEINPVAYGYLEENVRDNGAHAVEPRAGDCREVAPEDVADRVVLGYLNDTHRFLPTALRSLREGGWVHYHEAVPDVRADGMEHHLEGAARREGLRVQEAVRRRVKSYAPGVSHWVLDARLTPVATPRTRSP